MIKYFLILFIIPFMFCSAQQEKYKWDVKPSVTVDSHSYKDKQNSFTFLTVPFYLYQNLISDFDGDNCPFNPTCSVFFVKAVNETNVIKGILMFADRFTRDSNIFKTPDSYPIYANKFYDPVSNYKMNSNEIIIKHVH